MGRPLVVTIQLRLERVDGTPQDSADVVAELRDLVDELAVWVDESEYTVEIGNTRYSDRRI